MKNKLIIFLLILAPLLFHSINNYYILKSSTYCSNPDEVCYFNHIVEISQAPGRIKSDLKLLYRTCKDIFVWEYKPPLFFLTAAPFLSFGIDKNNVIMSNLLYFAILLFATYGIARKLYDCQTGLLSAFLVSMFPTVFALSRIMMTDFSLLAMVTLTFYLFVLNKFNSLGFSLLTGLVIGLGTFTRQAYFIFLLPALLYFFLHRENLKNKKIIRNFIFSITLALMIAAVYYAQLSLTDQLYFHHSFSCQTHTNPYFYLQSILNHQLLPVFSLLFLAGLFVSLKSKKYFLPLVTLTLLFIFSLSPNKQDRFILPVFPFIAIMISGFICRLPKFKKTAVLILILFSFLQFFIISYKNVLPAPYNYFQKFLSRLDNERISEIGLFSVIKEGHYTESCEKIIKIIADNFQKTGLKRKINLLFITQNWKICTTVDYLRIIKNLPFEIRKAEDDLFLTLTKNKTIVSDFDSLIRQADFIIIEEIPPDEFWFYTKNLHSSFDQNSNNFSLSGKIYFADGGSSNTTKVSIFENKCLKN